MNIAFIAHDSKKELMVQFCIAYYGILIKHDLCGTGKTAKTLNEATKLSVQKYMHGAQGGIQQIVGRIACDEIDILFFFRDPNSRQEDGRPDDTNILRMCDIHNIPLATNLATAESLIQALDRGDLKWREIERERNQKMQFL